MTTDANHATDMLDLDLETDVIHEQPISAASSRPAGSLFPTWIPVAIVVMLVSGHLAFQYQTLVTDDSARYARDTFRLVRDGWATHSDIFNLEMSFAYYAMFSGLVRVGLTHAAFPFWMNMISLVAGVVSLWPFWEVSKTVVGRTGAWYAVLLLAFTPGWWHLTHYGHPVTLGWLGFFLALCLMKRATSGNNSQTRILWFATAWLVLSTGLCFRGDIILLLPGFIGMALIGNPVGRKKRLFQFFAVAGSAALTYWLVRVALLGSQTAVEGGTLSAHIKNNLVGALLVKSVLKNSFLLVFSLNPFWFLLALTGAATLAYRRAWRQLVILGAWIAPLCAFLPFAAMDMGRLWVASFPAWTWLTLTGMHWLTKGKLRWPLVAALGAMSLLVSFAAEQGVPGVYKFTIDHHGTPIASIPVTVPMKDFASRQAYATDVNEVARQATQPRVEDVVLVCHSNNLPWYQFHLEARPDVVGKRQPDAANCYVMEYTTPHQRLFLFSPSWRCDPHEVEALFSELRWKDWSFHLSPFVSGTNLDPTKTLWSPTERIDDTTGFLERLRTYITVVTKK